MTMISDLSDLGIRAAEMRALRVEQQVAEEFGLGGYSQYDSSFIETSEMAKLSILAEPEKTDMPDAHDAAAAKKLGDLARSFDPSEIYASEIEETQLLCQTLEGIRAALECMRDHAAEIYRVETGRPFSTVKGSRVSSRLSASMIDARDYLAGRARNRREQYAPEGPVVAFSGGSEWHDHDILWNRLDQIARRIPNMILATTAQEKGCDAIACAWSAARGIKVIQFKLDRSKGSSAAFVRNDRIISLKPVEAVVCEGSGVQANFAQKLRAAGVPLHIFRRSDQCAADTPKARSLG
jgi:hypothetical protein